jgi:hypothetical protein
MAYFLGATLSLNTTNNTTTTEGQTAMTYHQPKTREQQITTIAIYLVNCGMHFCEAVKAAQTIVLIVR